MSHFRTFQSARENLSASDLINKKKCKTIYNDIKNKTITSSCKIQSDIYVNPFTKCLTGAQNYENLLNVTKGYYYEKSPDVDNIKQSNIWCGQYLYFDTTDGFGNSLCMIISKPNGTCNRFRYPSVQDNSSTHYPRSGDNLSSNDGNKESITVNGVTYYLDTDTHSQIVVDPSFNVFYKNGTTYGPEGTCNTYIQLSYLDRVKLNRKTINKLQFVQDQKISNQLGGFTYPSKFKFSCNKDTISSIIDDINNQTNTSNDNVETEPEQEPEQDTINTDGFEN